MWPRPVSRFSLSEPDVYTLLHAASMGDYPRMDRFNRVTDSRWVAAAPAPDEIFYRVSIAYDRNSNITSIEDQIHTTGAAGSGKRRTHGFTAQATGVYPGWDRFGRVVLHSWVDDTLTTNNGSLNGGNPSVPNKPPLFQESYTYDAAGNKLTRFDARPGASWADRGFQFA